MQNRKGMGIVLNNIGNIHLKMLRVKESIISYEKSLMLAQNDLIEMLKIENLNLFYKVKPVNGWK
jgi:hypothetical protein